MGDRGRNSCGCTLAVVVGLADHEHVLEERDESERVNDERESPNHVLRISHLVGERVVEHVQR